MLDPLEPNEYPALMRLLARLAYAHENEHIRRVARSLFTLISYWIYK